MSKKSAYSANFPNIQSHGRLMPMDALMRIYDRSLPGMQNGDYGLHKKEDMGERLSRSWNRMLALWRNFEQRRSELCGAGPGQIQTRKNFLLPLLQELGYDGLKAASPEQRKLGGESERAYPFSHICGHVPVHLLECALSLDQKQAGAQGAARFSPHALLQEYLNRSDKALWGVLSNGLSLRLLRKNHSLGGPAYVEFRLEDIFRGESFSEYALLWLAAHHTRLDAGSASPEKCWLEIWRRDARKASVAALDRLRDNVKEAIELLGRGFIAANPELRRRLEGQSLNPQDYLRQLLRLAWRFIFLFVIEERRLLHLPGPGQRQGREIYHSYWSLSRLRDLAMQTAGDMHCDLYEGVKFVMRCLGQKEGCPPLALAPLGGFLWSHAAMPDLDGLKLRNRDLLAAARALSWTSLDEEKRPVDWRHLGALELGAVYESLLELVAALAGEGFRLTYASWDSRGKKGAASGGERKKTGSYYTPAVLIDSLLDRSLEPLAQRALESPRPREALLDLKICDPACGSGHFLMAAAKRLALYLARLESGDRDPSPQALRRALREIVQRSIYGMDINPMSLEICKLGFWLETHEAGQPASFLDHRLVCANSLMGADSAAILEGLPEAAYTDRLEGNESSAVSFLKKSARSWKESQKRLQFEQFREEAERLIKAVAKPRLEDLPLGSMAEIEEYESAWRKWRNSPAWRRKKALYDLWTAAFVLPAFFPEKSKPLSGGHPFGVSWQSLLDCVSGGETDARLEEEAQKASRDYRFFHLELAFPEVAEKGGFDLIIGNPPWSNTLLRQRAWFGAHNRMDIASLPGKAREKAIRKLKTEDPVLYGLYREEARRLGAVRHFYKNSGLYPLCGRGRINLYGIFTEWMRKHINAQGLMACITPTGIVTDYSPRFFFQDLVRSKGLISVHDFENHSEKSAVKDKKAKGEKKEKYFEDVDSRFRFCLLTCGSGVAFSADKTEFVFLAHDMEDLKIGERRLELSAEDIALLNPNTLTAPIFLSKKELALARAVYGRFSILDRDGAGANPWRLKFSQGMLNMTSDSALFHKREDLEKAGWHLTGNVFIKGKQKCLPIYEGKMIHHFNHRWASAVWEKGKWKFQHSSAAELGKGNYAPLPRYWIEEASLAHKLGEGQEKEARLSLPLSLDDEKGEDENWDLEDGEEGVDEAFLDDEKPDQIVKMLTKYKWLFGLRGITNATNERSLIGGVFPMAAVGNSLMLLFSDSEYAPYLPALLSSLVCDFFLRRKLGGTNFNIYHARQLPVPEPDIFRKAAPWQPELSLAQWLAPRILELSFTSEDMRPLAEDLGYKGRPFAWNEERREEILAELEAAFFYLYLPCDGHGAWSRRHWRNEEDFIALQENFPLPRDAISFIMESFARPKKNETKNNRSFKIRDKILQAYDSLVRGIAAAE